MEDEIIKFGFFTDTHFSVVREGFRTDSFFESVLSKMEQSYAHFKQAGCEFALFGGDFFDRHASSSRPMIQAVRKVIMDSGMTTWFIWGQHDLLGYQKDSSQNSNLAFMESICDGRLMAIDDHVKISGVHVYASHVFQNPGDVLLGIPRGLKGPVVVVSHSLINPKTTPFGQVLIGDLPKSRANLVLSGDLHSGFDMVESMGTVFYNPGALARTSREQRRPRSCVVTMSKVLNGWQTDIENFYPSCEDFPFPEVEEEIKVSSDQDSMEYVEAFRRFKVESRDIFERLRKVGDEHGIPGEVLAYIESKKKS